MIMRFKNDMFCKVVIATALLVACDEKPEMSAGENTGNPDTGLPVDRDTSDIHPIEDLTTLTGMTYLVSFLPDYWSTPRNVGSEVGGYVPAFVFQINRVDATNGTFEALLSTATEDGSQNPCNKTMSVTGTLTQSDADTTFAFDPIVFESLLSGPEYTTIAPIHHFSIGGTFTDEGVGFKRGVMDAIMDFRDIACLFTLLANEEDRTPENICTLMLDSGYTCEPCPLDTEISLCITMKAELFKAQSVSLDLVPVDDFDLTCIEDTTCL